MLSLDFKILRATDLKEVENTGLAIGNIIRERKSTSPEGIFAFAYSAYLANKENCSNADDIRKTLRNNLANEEQYFIEENIDKEFDLVFAISDKLSTDKLLKYIIYSPASMDYRNMSFGTPDSIVDLAVKILNIENEDKVADFGCGNGNFLVRAILNSDASYYGNDINTTAKAMAKMKTSLLSNNANIEQSDMFTNDNNMKFDKIFSNYPFGMKIRHLSGGAEYLDKLLKEIPDVAKATSSDWIFNYLIVNSLRDNGKAIGIMTNGSTWNTIDKAIRKYFINKGLIECVIALPERMFETTSIPTTLIVLSKENKSIKMVDAHETFEAGRRQNSFSKEHIDKIVSWIEKDSDFSKTVSYEELVKNDYVISPTRYLADTITIKDAVEFGSVIKNITRGAQLRAAELDELTSQEGTSMQYLMLANIKEGMIDEELPYLKSIDEKYKKYCIHNRNMVLSKNGAPFKVAIAEVEEGKEILGNGNLYIIELNEEKVNPYFLKAFFESEQGIASLKNISVGTAMPNIPVDALKKMQIPVPSLDKQNIIAEKYLAKMDEIKVLNLRLVKAKNALKNIFEEVE